MHGGLRYLAQRQVGLARSAVSERERLLREVKARAQVDGMVTSEGTIYPLLGRLRRDGLVESSWRESASGPPRRYYRLTEGGRRALHEFRSSWRRFRNAVESVVSLEGAK